MYTSLVVVISPLNLLRGFFGPDEMRAGQHDRLFPRVLLAAQQLGT